MLGPLLPNYLGLLIARSGFKRLVLVAKVGSQSLTPALVGGRELSALQRPPHRGGLAGFHLYRALDNDIGASDRDSVVLDMYFLRALH